MMRKNGIDIETQIIFLAMFWGGGGPYEISQIIHAYDWINRGIPTREELEIALNTLLSLELITMNEDKFLIPTDIGMDFDAFRKRKRKGKFKIVKMYFDQFNQPTELPNTIQISNKQYSSELKKYKKFMAS
jgi:hypothetical protein